MPKTQGVSYPSHEKTSLVTGGAGFLGAHLCERLLNEGHRVICLDNCSTSEPENIAHLRANTKFTFIKHDITTPFDRPVDEIYNFACPASPPKYQARRVQTLKTSVLGTINLLELAAKYNAKIFQASTSEVYGNPHEHPQAETYWGNVNPVGERSCYDEGKRCAETLCFDYHREQQVDIRVARFFNTYGPKMHPKDGRVVSNFIMQALQGKDLTVYGDGSQTRSFCYVDDLIDGVMKQMNSEQNGPINLGNPHEFTILEVAKLIIKLTGSHSKITYQPLPSDDPIKRRPDISNAKQALNWEPKVNLEEGLQRTIEYFKPYAQQAKQATNGQVFQTQSSSLMFTRKRTRTETEKKSQCSPIKKRYR